MYVPLSFFILMNIHYNIQHHHIPSNFTCRERERGSVAAWLCFIFLRHLSSVMHGLQIVNGRAVCFVQVKAIRRDRRSYSLNYKRKQT